MIPPFINIAPRIQNTAGLSYRFFLLSFAPMQVYSFSARSLGIFREAGVYAIMLLLALYFELFETQKISVFRICLFCIAIALTYSTTGFLIIAMFFVCFIFKNMVDRDEKKKKRLIFTLAIIALFCAIFYTDIFSLSGEVFGKFSEESTTYVSGAARLASIVSNLMIFINNPLFGAGAYGVDLQFESMAINYFGYATIHNTNTFLSLFAAYGFLFGAIFTTLWYRFIKNRKSVFLSLLLFVSMFALLSGEMFVHNIIFYIIAFYGSTKHALIDNSDK